MRRKAAWIRLMLSLAAFGLLSACAVSETPVWLQDDKLVATPSPDDA